MDPDVTKAGVNPEHPTAQDLVVLKKVTDVTQVVTVFHFPALWDLIVWVKPNPNLAWRLRGKLIRERNAVVVQSCRPAAPVQLFALAEPAGDRGVCRRLSAHLQSLSDWGFSRHLSSTIMGLTRDTLCSPNRPSSRAAACSKMHRTSDRSTQRLGARLDTRSPAAILAYSGRRLPEVDLVEESRCRRIEN